ncbi:hypothetical protein GOV05_02240 [Candidatus Woesearchaeota archaeon]|nr:hypothetical protein [Candidatus Woesearchaeota archaeon]
MAKKNLSKDSLELIKRQEALMAKSRKLKKKSKKAKDKPKKIVEEKVVAKPEPVKKAKVKEAKPKKVKKEEKPKKKAKTEKPKDYTTIIATVAVVVAIALIAFFIIKKPVGDEQTPSFSDGDALLVLASVNGEDITQAQIDDIYSKIPPQNRFLLTKEALLDQLITEKLLLQKADELNISIEDSEVEEFFELVLATNQLSEEELEVRLAEQNMSVDELRDEIRKQITLTKLIEVVVVLENVTEEQALTYYDENQDLFVANPAQVNASHILICYVDSVTGCDENRSLEEALERAEMITGLIDEDEDNFAELAVKYSDGPSGPNGGSLGLFPRGVMVGEFEEVAFSLEVGNVSEPVMTQFGYHIIKVFDKQEESAASFEDAKQGIMAQLETQDRQTEFQDFVSNLRNESEVVMYEAE